MNNELPVWLLKMGYASTIVTTVLSGMLIFAGYHYIKDESKSLIGAVLKKKNRTAFRF